LITHIALSLPLDKLAMTHNKNELQQDTKNNAEL